MHAKGVLTSPEVLEVHSSVRIETKDMHTASLLNDNHSSTTTGPTEFAKFVAAKRAVQQTIGPQDHIAIEHKLLDGLVRLFFLFTTHSYLFQEICSLN